MKGRRIDKSKSFVKLERRFTLNEETKQTICTIRVKSVYDPFNLLPEALCGAVFVGKSMPFEGDKFDAGLGRTIARNKAEEKLWGAVEKEINRRIDQLNDYASYFHEKIGQLYERKALADVAETMINKPTKEDKE